MVHRNLAEKCFFHFIELIIILGWNSRQVSILLQFDQQTRYHINAGPEPVICFPWIDMLYHNILKHTVQLRQKLSSYSPYLRPKPPWSYIYNTYLTYGRLLRYIIGSFPHSGKSTSIDSSVSQKLGRFHWFFQQNNLLTTNSSHIVELSDFTRHITIDPMSLPIGLLFLN
jgi:hypothetical protein